MERHRAIVKAVVGSNEETSVRSWKLINRARIGQSGVGLDEEEERERDERRKRMRQMSN